LLSATLIGGWGSPAAFFVPNRGKGVAMGKNLPSHSRLALVIDDGQEFYSDVFTMRPVERERWLPVPPCQGNEHQERALRLRAKGYTPYRIFRRLRREFPEREWAELKRAAGLGRPARQRPLWVSIGRPPINPVSTRSDPRKHPSIQVEIRTVSWEELMATQPIDRFDRELREAYERARKRHERERAELAARIKVVHPQLQAKADDLLAEIMREVKEQRMAAC